MLMGLVWTALLMGLGGIVHCAAMCGAPCAAAMPQGVPIRALLGRCLAYALLGAVAATASGLISQWGQTVSMFQPIWLMLQLAAVVLGIWLLWTGRMPMAVNTWGVQTYHRARDWMTGPQAPALLRNAQGTLPFFAGMAWAVMPCGLLYGALLVAALAPQAWGGALVMLAFAIPSAVGVWLAPALLRRLLSGKRFVPATSAGQAVPILWHNMPVKDAQDEFGSAASLGEASPEQGAAARLVDPRWAVRLAGLSLAVIAAWSVSHLLVAQWEAWCA